MSAEEYLKLKKIWDMVLKSKKNYCLLKCIVYVLEGYKKEKAFLR